MSNSPFETRRPKQARALRTRERILDQAEDAFGSKGFEGTSLTSDILEPAGISVGSFYHQFPDKRAVLRALLEERRGAWDVRMTALLDTGQPADEVLRAGLGILLDDVAERPAAWWVRIRELHHADPEIRALLEAEWFEWVRTVARLLAHWASDDDDLGAGATTFLASGIGGLVRRYLTADDAERAELRGAGIDETVRIFTAALSVPC